MKLKLCLLAIAAAFMAGTAQRVFAETTGQQQRLYVSEQSTQKDDASTVQADSEEIRHAKALRDFRDKHVTFKGYLFKVELSKDEAMKLGVTSEDYDELCKGIEAGNRSAEESIQKFKDGKIQHVRGIYNGTVIYELGDDSNEASGNDSIRAAMKPLTWPYGVLTTGGPDDEQAASFPYEPGMKGINCTFTSDCGNSGVHKFSYMSNGYWYEIVTCGNKAREIKFTAPAGSICQIKYETEGCAGRCVWAIF